MKSPVRIAMWSGPRNISTAMMRAWGNRADTTVVDEPLYPHYLKATGANHPGAEEVIAAGETDWRRVVERLTGEIPDAKRIFYQKQMTHHLLPGMDRAWLSGVSNCFLIRDPRAVIASYMKKNHEPSLQDLGFVQEREIFESVRARTGCIPPVLDARDVLERPERILTLLCEAVGVEFDRAMLSWPPGGRETDGIWAKYWYAEVERTTSFRAPEGRTVQLPERLLPIAEQCREHYEALHQHRLH